MSGYSLRGKRSNDKIPNATSSALKTSAKTGRFTETSERSISTSYSYIRRACAKGTHAVGNDFITGAQTCQDFNDTRGSTANFDLHFLCLTGCFDAPNIVIGCSRFQRLLWNKQRSAWISLHTRVHQQTRLQQTAV